MVVHSFIPSTWEVGADRCEFQASLSYKVSSRTARAVTQRNPVLNLPPQKKKRQTDRQKEEEKRKKIEMKFTGKWAELEKIILSQVFQTQKDKYGMYSLICGC